MKKRRSYSKSFKALVFTECAQPDTPVANVALKRYLDDGDVPIGQ